MHGLHRNALSIGLGIGATALLMTAGPAKAATCPSNDPLSVVAAPGFSCTLGDKTFSDFSFSTDLSTHILFTINPLTGDDVVTFSRDGALYNTGANTFGYMVSIGPTAAPGTTIDEHTLGIDVSTALPPSTITDHFTGNNSGNHVITATNGGTFAVATLPGDTSEMVMITATQPAKAQLNSLTNDFGQSTSTGVPEPMSLSLFGLGLLGLGLVRRRPS